MAVGAEIRRPRLCYPRSGTHEQVATGHRMPYLAMRMRRSVLYLGGSAGSPPSRVATFNRAARVPLVHGLKKRNLRATLGDSPVISGAKLAAIGRC